MRNEKIKIAALELEAALKANKGITIIDALNTCDLQKLIDMGKSGDFKEPYSGPLPWSFGFLDGWFAEYPKFESIMIAFENAIKSSIYDLTLDKKIDEMIDEISRKIGS